MAKNKIEKFFPKEDEIAMVGVINKEVKIAFSVEKADYGYYVVRYELNDDLEGLKNTIRYKRIDLKEKDTKKNRLVFTNQEDAEREAISSYKELFNYIQSKNGNSTN
jgi:hypothetical protein